jgi:hypothetical protein
MFGVYFIYCSLFVLSGCHNLDVSSFDNLQDLEVQYFEQFGERGKYTTHAFNYESYLIYNSESFLITLALWMYLGSWLSTAVFESSVESYSC